MTVKKSWMNWGDLFEFYKLKPKLEKVMELLCQPEIWINNKKLQELNKQKKQLESKIKDHELLIKQYEDLITLTKIVEEDESFDRELYQEMADKREKFLSDCRSFRISNLLSGEYDFKCRNKNVTFTKEMLDEINAQIDHLCTLRFEEDELDYLRSIRFVKPDYVEFLRLWHPIRDYVFTDLNETTGELIVRVKGPLFSCMQFEIYLLEIINEVYFRMKYADQWANIMNSAYDRLNDKIARFNDGTYNFKFAEFGCRRRLSSAWEDTVVSRFAKETKNMVGTSNVYLAKKYRLTPIGTYAHEYVQMYQGIPKIPLAYTNYYALKDWYNEYKGDLGTALTDTITTDLFLLDFDRSMCNNFTGVRHDSGDPIEWGEKIIRHYEKYGIDPKTKTLLFSDSLDFDKAQGLYDHFKDRIKVSFGIGTFVSNDTCVDPLNIVIKLQSVNGNPVAKLSDSPGKTMCRDHQYTEYLRSAVQFRLDRECVLS